MSCTDGNCVYRTDRGGMSTNGGCRTLSTMRRQMVRKQQRHLLMKVLEELSDEQAVRCLEVGLRNLTESELRCVLKGE